MGGGRGVPCPLGGEALSLDIALFAVYNNITHWVNRCLCEDHFLRVRFESKRLAALYTEEAGARRYPSEVVDAFFEVMAAIASAVDERDLYALKGVRFEKLKGARKHERSMRLNKAWRLIVRLERDDKGKLLVVIDLENHYGD